MSLLKNRPQSNRVTGNGSQNGSPLPIPGEDAERLRWIKHHLYVAVVSDILDSMGLRQQTMHHRLRPLDPENCEFVGRARTFRWMETDYVIENDPYGLEIEAMDSLRPGDVVVHSTDSSLTNAPWGELMSTVAKRNGAEGCVCDGLIRDCKRIMKASFPVFHTGIRPVDSKGRGLVMAYDKPVKCGDVLVHSGDLIFADFDGVVVIPRRVEEKVVLLARDKVAKENASRAELLKGRSLRDVFEKYGVL